MERRRQSKSAGLRQEPTEVSLDRLQVLRSIGGKQRSKDEEREYKKLMERRRQNLKKENCNQEKKK